MADKVWFSARGMSQARAIGKALQERGLWSVVNYSKIAIDSPKSFSDASKLNMKSYNYQKIPSKTYDLVFQDYHIFLRAFIRLSPVSTFEVNIETIDSALHYYNMLVNYLYQRLTNESYDLVIFNRIPHLGSDYLLYKLSKILGIKCLIMQQSHFPNRFYYMHDLNEFGNFSENAIMRHEAFKLGVVKLKDPWYMKAETSQGVKAIKSKFKRKFDAEINLYNQLMHKPERYGAYIRYILKKTYLINKRKFIFVSKAEMLEEKFVYFALHLQPEATTDILGGKYQDQLLAIEELSSFIPKNWLIYVKENPKQGYMYRDQRFFDRLNKIPKVKLVSENVSTFALINYCQFTSTITGTVGWESLLSGKKTLIFGWGTWYKNFPGVFNWLHHPKLEDILNYTIDYVELEHSINVHLSKTAKGVVYDVYSKNYPKYDSLENNFFVAESLIQILYK
jgi:hypothetical protein